jgi:RNA polymerase sigma factor (sigma-70 family)
MSSEGDQGSVTHWIGELKRDGDAVAQHLLWERYFEQLVRVARKKLGTAPRAVADEEDAAACAFRSFFEGVRRDRFPDLADRDDLWGLLIKIAKRKASKQIRYITTQGRDAKKVVGQATLDAAQDGRGLDQFHDAQQVRGGEAVGVVPSPEKVAITIEKTRRYLDALRDPTLRRVAEMHLQGFTAKEIAKDLGCSRETVQRKLKLIRGGWRHLEEEIQIKESQRYLDALQDPTLRRVAEMYLQGSAIDEIAKDLGCVGETVQRKLQLIREEWSRFG